MNSSFRFQVKLTCGHWTRIPLSQFKGLHKCRTCDEFQRVIGTWRQEWVVYCLDCSFTRWTGQSERDAYRLQRSHRQSTPTHWTNVLYTSPEKVLDRSRQGADVDDTLPLSWSGEAEPPF